MGQEYRLVSEDEWQQLQSNLKWCEAEAAQAIHLERASRWNMTLHRLLVPHDDPLQDTILSNQAHRAAIRQIAQLPQVQAIIVDSLSGANTVDENSAAILQHVKFLAELARDTNKPVLLAHHLRKKAQQPGGACCPTNSPSYAQATVESSRFPDRSA